MAPAERLMLATWQVVAERDRAGADRLAHEWAVTEEPPDVGHALAGLVSIAGAERLASADDLLVLVTLARRFGGRYAAAAEAVLAEQTPDAVIAMSSSCGHASLARVLARRPAEERAEIWARLWSSSPSRRTRRRARAALAHATGRRGARFLALATVAAAAGAGPVFGLATATWLAARVPASIGRRVLGRSWREEPSAGALRSVSVEDLQAVRPGALPADLLRALADDPERARLGFVFPVRALAAIAGGPLRARVLTWAIQSVEVGFAWARPIGQDLLGAVLLALRDDEWAAAPPWFWANLSGSLPALAVAATRTAAAAATLRSTLTQADAPGLAAALHATARAARVAGPREAEAVAARIVRKLCEG